MPQLAEVTFAATLEYLGQLPTSVQVVGKWGAETDVLRMGALLEGARPWAQHRPPAP